LRKKILFIVPTMLGGGAERVMLTLLKHLPREQFDLSLALVEKVGSYLDELPNDVVVYDLEAGRVRYSVIKIVRLINEIKPDIVFSTLGHLNIALMMAKRLLPKDVKVVIREAITVSSQMEQIMNMPMKILWNNLYKRFYPRADKIICQADFMKEDLRLNYHIPDSKMKVVYNPVDIYLAQVKTKERNPFQNMQGTINLIAVGRLEEQKGYHRIITRFPDLLRNKENAHLWFLGEGILKEELYQQALHLGINERVHFVGFQENPYTWMAHADLFVMSSIYEGLPNVLLEAMACGCPVVSLEHPGGTREIFEITGQLDRFVKELTWEDKWFEKPSPEVRRKLEETFGLEKVIVQYTEVFNDLLMDGE
jgi:glycosyltransferase involved in cell wall biosynthesis